MVRRCLRGNSGQRDWSDVRSDDIKGWLAFLLDSRYSDAYVNNQYRALQQFFRWYSEEEELPNPMAKMQPPKVGEKVVPVFTAEELSSLAKTCRGKTFIERDKAIIALFKATGIRHGVSVPAGPGHPVSLQGCWVARPGMCVVRSVSCRQHFLSAAPTAGARDRPAHRPGATPLSLLPDDVTPQELGLVVVTVVEQRGGTSSCRCPRVGRA